jgi:hypothetical protein
MPFQFPPEPVEGPIILHIIGNCRVVHHSVKEWADCPNCNSTRPLDLRWWITTPAPTPT